MRTSPFAARCQMPTFVSRDAAELIVSAATPGQLQRRHLILHQGDQRRHYDRKTALDEGWNLKTQRFS